jgi:glycosyltransferase involved in cell wall biosynthesis
MNILITNLFVDHNSGTETFVETLADGLKRAGHNPMLYAAQLGPQAERMRQRGHVVTDRIATLPARPDVIHAQHVSVALAALAAFPETPVLNYCHSALFQSEAPILHPNVRRYVAVDEHCRARCLADGAPAERLSVLLNPVDLEKFQIRGPLPDRPRRAVLLGKRREHRPLVKAACAAAGLELDEVGGRERFSIALEKDLLVYDLVFAAGRSALEAAACGCSVIVCDNRGFAGLLTSRNMDAWRRFNLGVGLFARPNTAEAISEAIAQYDPVDARTACTRIREQADLAPFVAALVGLYQECLADPPPGQPAAGPALAHLLEELLPSPAAGRWKILAGELDAFRWHARAGSPMTSIEAVDPVAFEWAARLVHESYGGVGSWTSCSPTERRRARDAIRQVLNNFDKHGWAAQTDGSA